MSSLFSDLPALAGGKQDVGAEEPSQAANKRRKLDPTEQIDRQKPSGSSLFSDPVVAALVKITTHISSSKKFNKASELLRQLIVGDKIGQERSKLVFEALKAALQHPDNAEDPQLRREYLKLFTIASKVAEMFSARERSQLDVYGIWAVTRNQLHTDDSFTFNRMITRIKESVSHLSEADEEEEAALQAIKGRLPEEPQLPEPDSPERGEVGVDPQDPPEADPFGLDALVPEQKKKVKPAKPSTWAPKEILGMKREALLDCYTTLQACYGQPWARTSVDLAIEDLSHHKEKFCSSQQPRIDGLAKFVKEQRARRKQGGAAAAREVRRDTTAFESARREWGRASISARGKVGAGGDHQSEQWLG